MNSPFNWNRRRRHWVVFPMMVFLGLMPMIIVIILNWSKSSRLQTTDTPDLNTPFVPNTDTSPSFSQGPPAPIEEVESGNKPGGTSNGKSPATPGNTLYLPLVTTSTPAARKPYSFEKRPYSSDSVWNTPFPSNPEYDPHSVEMVATIGLEGGGQITSDPNQYSYPVYFADETTPRWDIPCTQYKCTVYTPKGVQTGTELLNVPIPEKARPSAGTDAQMIIIDRTTKAEYDLWQVESTSNGWTASNASSYNTTWDGAPERYGSRGAGVPYLAGLIRAWEVAQGRIEHAIAFGYPNPTEGRCVFPASKTDGKSNLLYAIPQGARLQLDPSLTEADFNRMGLGRTGKIIARALQEYGMILIDTSGRAKIYAEDLTTNPYSPVQWTDPALDLTSTTIAAIPYTSYRVLKLPKGYWNPGSGTATHGDCYVEKEP